MEPQRTFNKREVLEYVGDISQIFGIKEYTLMSGKAKGVRAIDIRNGSGLEFTLLADRCMDIAGLSFKGVNYAYISKSGIVAPEYYNERESNLLRNFFAGFLTTCGLRNVGNACEDAGEYFGLHGRISNTPAEEFCYGIEWKDEIPEIVISGTMKEARMYGENLILSRKISCKYGFNSLLIQNTVENLGFRREPLMLLFHFNIGYPLLDEDAQFLTSTSKLYARDSVAEKEIDNYFCFQKPTVGYREQVFYHDLNTDESGNAQVALINKKMELGFVLQFNKNQLFNFTQWKQMGQGDYVLGLEPCNCDVGGRSDAKSNGMLEYLEPGECRNFDLSIDLLDGMEEISRAIKRINLLS